MSPSVTQLQDIPLTALHESPWNPRKHFDKVALSELAHSILEKGVVEPILVRPNRQGFEIVAGTRRVRAAKMIGNATIPAIVRELDDVAALELAVIENQQRADMHPLDEAEGYAALIKRGKAYTPAIVAAKVGKSESYIYRRLKLLELEPALKEALARDALSVAHAEKLLRLSPALRTEAADPTNGVVWRRSPLLDFSADWTPSADDLRPLAELEHFVRTRSAFSPADPAARHFQPELAQQLVTAAAKTLEAHTVDPQGVGSAEMQPFDAAVDEAIASFVQVSEDPMARSRLRAPKGAAIPLTPSHWREVTSEKQRCSFTRRAVVTHGGPARVLEVCTTRRCQKHFPPAKTPTTTTSAASANATPKDAHMDRWEAQQRRQREEAERWERVLALVRPAVLERVKGITFSAALVRFAIDDYTLLRVKREYGLELSEQTAAAVMALAPLETYSKRALQADLAQLGVKLDFAPFEKQAAQAAKADKQAVATPATRTKAKGAKATRAKAKGGKR